MPPAIFVASARLQDVQSSRGRPTRRTYLVTCGRSVPAMKAASCKHVFSVFLFFFIYFCFPPKQPSQLHHHSPSVSFLLGLRSRDLNYRRERAVDGRVELTASVITRKRCSTLSLGTRYSSVRGNAAEIQLGEMRATFRKHLH